MKYFLVVMGFCGWFDWFRRFLFVDVLLLEVVVGGLDGSWLFWVVCWWYLVVTLFGKARLKKTVDKACLNFYELQIALSGIEIKINSRP